MNISFAAKNSAPLWKKGDMMPELDWSAAGATVSGGISEAGIRAVEAQFSIEFPSSYRRFLQRHGSLRLGPIAICGLGVPLSDPCSVIATLQLLHQDWPDFPNNMIPIEVVGANKVACLVSTDNPEIAPVVYWDLNIPASAQRPSLASHDFDEYIRDRVIHWKYREQGLRNMERHVQHFEVEYLNHNKLARNHVWRPYRFCVQDVVLGLVVVRHSLENNCLEVDVCMTSDVPEYEDGSGARMTTAFLLSEAYKCGGTMEIRFSEQVEGGRVPTALSNLAESLGVALHYANEGRLSPSEARTLFIALVGFDSALHDRVVDLAKEGRLSPERVCYAIFHGIWTKSEVESLVFGSLQPEIIFSGEVYPEQRTLYRQAQAHARAAILGGFLDRKLAKRDRLVGDAAVDLEDDTRRLTIRFDPTYYMKLYECDEDFPIPWLRDTTTHAGVVMAGHQLVVLVRPRNAWDLSMHVQQDLIVAGQLASASSRQSTICVVVPRDFEELSTSQINQALDAARTAGVNIIICPETVAALDMDVMRRLNSSRIIRQ